MDLEDTVFGAAFPEDAATGSTVHSRQTYAPAVVEARGASGLVGLSNQGATCYLNSSLQSLFMCPELRSRILALTPDELNLHEYEVEEQHARDDEVREAAARAAAAAAGTAFQAAPSKAPEISAEDIAELTDSYGFSVNLAKKALRKCPLPAQREMAINYLLEGDVSDTEEEGTAGAASAAVASSTTSSSEEQPAQQDSDTVAAAPRPKPRRIPIELQRLFARLLLLQAKATSTSALTNSFGWGGGAVAVQQDVFELTTQLLDALERSLKGTSGASLIADLFKFKMVNRIRCSECHGMSAREEEYMGMPVTVQGCASLHDALAQTCALELFTGANLYRCSMGCDNRKTEAARSTAFRSLPDILMMNLNRFTWNEHGERVKLAHRCVFPLVLDMAPYLEPALPIADLVAKAIVPFNTAYRSLGATASVASDAAATIVAAAADGSAAATATVTAAATAATAITAATAAATTATVHASQQDGKASKRNQKGKKGKRGDDDAGEAGSQHLCEPVQFDAMSPHLYDLFAVLIHAGTPYGGHYTAKIQDLVSLAAQQKQQQQEQKSVPPEPSPQWFSFDDTVVKPIDVHELAAQYGGSGNPQTAYMLFYRRRSLGPPATVPAVAAHLQALLDADNQRAAVERAAYETFMNAISVCIYPERALRCRRDQGDDALQLRGSSASDQQDADGADPHDRSTHVTVDIDRRAPLADLLAAVHAALSSRSALALAAGDSASSLVFAPPAAAAADVRLAQLDTSSRSHLALYRLRGLRDVSSADLVVSIADSGISNGNRLVAFDGRTICGAPPSFSERKGSRLVLHISHLVSNRQAGSGSLSQPVSETGTAAAADEEAAQHTAHQLTFVGAKDESTVDDLLAFLTAHTQLAADAMHVNMLRHNSLRAIDFLESSSVGAASKSSRKGGRRLLVDDMGMADGWTLTVETVVAQTSQSLAHAEMRARMTAVRLSIVHSCEVCSASTTDLSQSEPPASPAEFSLSTRSSTSLAAFKAMVVSRLPDACRIQHAALGFRLRRRMGRSKEGALFHDESVSLAACGLDEDDLFVQIEHGPLPAAHEAELGVSVRDPVSQRRREFRMLLDLRRTVRETKVRILREAELPHEEDKHVRAYCLHRTDVTWNERGKLFANEAVSLEKLGIGSGDNLWMEEGALPTKGLVNLDVYLYEPHPNSSAAFCRARLLESRAALLIPGSSEAGRGVTLVADDNAKTDTHRAGNVAVEFAGAAATAATSTVAVSVAAIAVLDTAPVETDTVATVSGVQYGIHRIFSLEAQSGEPLRELRLALHSNPQLAARAPSATHLRVRLFRGHAPGKLVPADDRALNKQGITADRSVIVQVVSTPDDGCEAENQSAKIKTVTRPRALSAFAQLLQVYLAVPHPSKDGALLHSMFPVDVLWDGGVARADYESLHASVFAALDCHAASSPSPSAAPCNYLLAKWASSERRWILLAPEFAAQESRLAAEAEEKKNSQRSAQLQSRTGADARSLAVSAIAVSSTAATTAAVAASEVQGSSHESADIEAQQTISDAADGAAGGTDRTDVDDAVMASLSDAELEQLLASGFDLDTGSVSEARAVLAKSKSVVQRALGSRSTKAPKTIVTKAPKNLKSSIVSADGRAYKVIHANAGKGSVAALSEKQLEMLGLRGKPYLVRDGDVLVAIDTRDLQSLAPCSGDAAATAATAIASADVHVAAPAPTNDAISRLAQCVATWGPPPGALAGGAGGAGQNDLQRAIEESLRGVSSGGAPEVGIHIDVDV